MSREKLPNDQNLNYVTRSCFSFLRFFGILSVTLQLSAIFRDLKTLYFASCQHFRQVIGDFPEFYSAGHYAMSRCYVA